VEALETLAKDHSVTVLSLDVGPGAAITPEESAAGFVKVIDQLALESTGSLWKWNGGRHGW
jgi:hypothetical protein